MASSGNGVGEAHGRVRSRAAGRITVVQEERFLLVTDSGLALRLELAHDARLQPADLRRLQQAGIHVDVEYEGEPGLASAGAHSVRSIGADERTNEEAHLG